MYLHSMKIRLYIYDQSIGWAQLEVLGKKHMSADVRDLKRYNSKPTIEICTSATTLASKNDNHAMIAMCERDVKQGYARALDIDAEPTEKSWQDWGISFTSVPFDFNTLKETEHRE